MQASKAILWVALLGGGVAAGFFSFFEDARPDFVENWFRKAKGYGPAQTPTEALEKFRECVRKRDYKTAVVYCGGEYAEYLRMGAKPARKLGDAIDDLHYNVDEVAHINSEKATFVLSILEPFPKDFVFDLKQSADDRAYAVLAEAAGKPFLNRYETWNVDARIFRSLVPSDWNGAVELRYEGSSEKGWKIYFPVSAALRAKVDYLKQNYGNYLRGLENLKYSVKHDAATKSQFEQQLRTELESAK